MNSLAGLLKKMLPGLLPLLIFIVADEVWGTKVGIIVAIALGVAEMIFIGIKEKRLDRFVLFDTLLLTAMGGISLWLENDIFFKIKPAIINAIFCVVIGLSAFSGKNLLLLYSQRYFKDVKINEQQQRQMQRMLQIIFWLMLVYTALVLYAAFYMSTAAWGFISGGLFYIIFGIIFAGQLIQVFVKRRKIKKEDMLPWVDDEGKILGQISRTTAHSGTGEKYLHPVVHLHVLSSKGEIYLQKRAMNKRVQPGMWDTSVGGHVDPGESIEQALMREAAEELSIKDFKLQHFARYKWETDIEAELVFSFVTQYEGPFQLQAAEIDEGRFWSFKEIEQNIGKGVFTPNFEHEFGILRRSLKFN